MNRLLASLAIVLAAATNARADVPTATAAAFAATDIAQRNSALAELEAAQPGDPAASYAAGAVHFFLGLEKLSQGLYRHGFETPQSFMLPLMRLPIPDNPNPEPLTYEQFRQIFADFQAEMREASVRLAEVPQDAGIGIEVDLAKLGIDINNDGSIAPDESAVAIMAALNGGALPSDPTAPAPNLTFRFDRADGYWLDGYAHFLSAQAKFWLAHDFRAMFDQSFHMLFPRAGLPLQQALVPTAPPTGMISSEWRIADALSMIHLINWPVVDPQLRKEARQDLLEMIKLSRQNWRAIRAETDNDREWLPGPHQTGVHVLTGLEVTEQEVLGWTKALDLAERLLNGEILMPHFRFADGGLDMKRFFEEPKAFDLVLMLTGPGAVPYYSRGPVISDEDWNEVQREFGRGGFMSFALWFN